jgi:hypothetical protein
MAAKEKLISVVGGNTNNGVNLSRGSKDCQSIQLNKKAQLSWAL